MIPADQNHTSSFAEEISEVTEKQQCPSCNLLQLEEAGPEMPEEKVEQDGTPETVKTQQCPSCNLLQLEEEPVPKMELSCACSKPVAVDNGIPAGPEQVLAQYNSRPPILNTNPGRPISAAPIPITNRGRPVSTAPIQIRPTRVQPVYVAPRPINTCSGRPAYAGPVPVHSSPKR
jgi:hypothetical protein